MTGIYLGSFLHTDSNEDLHAWLNLAGLGDTRAFARMYDSLATATYTVCTRTGSPDQDSAMHKTWLYIWVNAASLRLLKIPTRTLILEIAQEMATTTR